MRTLSRRSTIGLIGAVLVVGGGTAAAVVLPRGASSAEGAPTPRPDGLPAATALGVTELAVRDLPAVLAYYRDALGLTVLEESSEEAVLGSGTPLLHLRATTDASPSQQEAGLYHTAFLYSDPALLASVLARVAQTAPQSFQGSADHLVSRAFYLGDPEGNGVELYVDRPREGWVWRDGRVEMGSEALDPGAFLDEHLTASPVGSVSIGHMHLKVGDLEQARSFYADALGFDVVSEAEGALFFSAGGYHHHIATNVWQSEGAGVRASGTGLGSLTVLLLDATALAAVAGRLEDAGRRATRAGHEVVTADPWGNTVRLLVDVA